MTDEQLRGRGFRRVPRSFSEPGALAAFMQEFGYEVRWDDGTLWLRRVDRVRGAPAPRAVAIGPTIKAGDIHRADTYEFLREYSNGDYGGHQGTLPLYRTGDLQAAITRRLEAREPFRKWHAVTYALTFAHPNQLRSLLEDVVLPAFFERDPSGMVQVVQLGDWIDRQFAVLRAGYAMSHFPIGLVHDANRGFAAMSEWDAVSPRDFVESAVSIVQASTYPYVPMFHGGPFGLWLCFLLSVPEQIQLDVFPRSWMHWTRSGGEFGTEALDGMLALREPGSELGRRLAHRRHLMARPLDVEACHSLLLWAVGRADMLLREASDPTNFEQNGDIDFVSGFEHSLSMLRVFRRAIYILGSEEPPHGKLTVFEMADLLQELRNALTLGDREGLFKRLFNPTSGLALCETALAHLPPDVRPAFQALAATVYGELRSTAEASIWIRDKVKDGRVLVRSRNLDTENPQDLDEFVGTLMRALRNTHHGYFSKLDRGANRPSRYLAMSTGNVPDSLSSLALIWALCVLADAEAITGWKPLSVGTFE